MFSCTSEVKKLDSRFAGMTVVDGSRGMKSRAELLLWFIERHIGAHAIKKYEHAEQWIGDFQNLSNHEYDMFVTEIDYMIEDIQEVSPKGTLFEYHWSGGGCLGFWPIEDLEV